MPKHNECVVCSFPRSLKIGEGVMPLRKLWNAIRGKSAVSTGNTNPPPELQVAQADVSPSQPQASVAAKPVSPKAISGTATRDDKKLFRRIESLTIQSVLEVCVGNGLRSLAMLQTLTHKGHSTPIHYIAIDEFEMAGNELSLRDFHKQLREYPAKAHLVPMAIDAGLDRVVRTYGQVDLVIWSANQPPTSAQQTALARLSKPTTIVFAQQDGRWSESLASVSKASVSKASVSKASVATNTRAA